MFYLTNNESQTRKTSFTQFSFTFLAYPKEKLSKQSKSLYSITL